MLCVVLCEVYVEFWHSRSGEPWTGPLAVVTYSSSTVAVLSSSSRHNTHVEEFLFDHAMIVQQI